jgi:hypothetical protein
MQGGECGSSMPHRQWSIMAALTGTWRHASTGGNNCESAARRRLRAQARISNRNSRRAGRKLRELHSVQYHRVGVALNLPVRGESSCCLQELAVIAALAAGHVDVSGSQDELQVRRGLVEALEGSAGRPRCVGAKAVVGKIQNLERGHARGGARDRVHPRRAQLTALGLERSQAGERGKV